MALARCSPLGRADQRRARDRSIVSLTFCVPTWNGASFLPTRLRALLAVRSADVEVLVGDDASEDGSAEVARRVASDLGDRRVTVHAFRERLGLAGNWNRVLRLARGDCVCLFGQDDHCRPDFAEKLGGVAWGPPGRRPALWGGEVRLPGEEEPAQGGGLFRPG